MSGNTIGLISIGIMIVINIITVAFGYGRLIELTKGIRDSLAAHCLQNEKDRAEEMRRIERLEDKVFDGSR